MNYKTIKIAFLSLFIFAASSASAQKLVAETQTIDVGQVIFGHPASATFELRNHTNKNATITNIETSCGCTTATTNNTKVMGGKILEINATFDGQTMGHFHKQIWVYEDDNKQPLELVLRGVVVNELQEFGGVYGFKIGGISVDREEIEFDDVNRGERPEEKMHIMNTTSEYIQPVIMHLPSYLEAEVSPTRIAPGRNGIITFRLLSDKVRDMGLTQTSVYLGHFPGDKVSKEKMIPSSVILLPSFDGMTENQDRAAIAVSDTVLFLSDMSGKPKKKKAEVVITNTGTATLAISSLQMFTAGLQLSLSSETIAPGEKVKLKIIANAKELANQRRPRILMITNDPSRPKVVIEIKP